MPVIHKLFDKISDYIRLKGEKLKLDIIAHVSRLLARFVTFLLIGLVSFFMVTFLSIALGAYLNAVLDSSHLGYLIIAGFYLLCLIGFLIFLRLNEVQKWLETLFIKFSEDFNTRSEEENE